jgi:Ribosomal protein L34E
MPKPSLRRKPIRLVKTPSGKHVIRKIEKKRNKDKCAICKGYLHGTYHGKVRLSKSSRRPKRIFGGYICSSCLQKLIETKIISEIKI